MKTIDEILSSGAIYSDKLSIGDDGLKGFIFVNRLNMSFVASWGGGWDHVSVAPLKKKITPDWETMCRVKDIFFKPEEAVIQIHPPETEYVNLMQNCLHLWRANDKPMLLPPSFMVGPRKEQTIAELQTEIEEYYKPRENLKNIISEEITRKYGRWDKKVTVAEFETFIRDMIDRLEAES